MSTCDRDINKYVRVSEILSKLRDRSAINPTVLSEKAQIGTEVHNNIHTYKTGGFQVFDDWPIRNPHTGEILYDKNGEERWEQRGLGYFRSFSEWDKTFKPEFVMMEKRLYCDDMMLTGQIDALIKAETSEKPILCDFKTSYKADEEMWNMQAHFYYYLLMKNGYDVGNKFAFLQLKKNGAHPEWHIFKFDKKVLDRCMKEASMFLKERNIEHNLDLNVGSM